MEIDEIEPRRHEGTKPRRYFFSHNTKRRNGFDFLKVKSSRKESSWLRVFVVKNLAFLRGNRFVFDLSEEIV
jgi:hypothetical protein